MPVERPGKVTAAGVLAIIYGSLGLLCGLCSVVGLVAQGAMGGNMFAGADPMQARLQQELQRAMENAVPGYQAVQIISAVLTLIIAVALLSSGIGLLRMSSVARTVTIVFCWITIVSYLLQVTYQLALVMPAMNNAFQVILPQAMGPAPPQVLQAMRSMMSVIAIVTVFLYGLIIAYLITILILLAGARVRQAFADAALGGSPRMDDRYDRPEPHDRPRRNVEDDDDRDYRRPNDDPDNQGLYR